MREKMKPLIWSLLVLVAIIMMFPVERVSAASRLSQKDFVYKVDGKKYDFVKKVSAKAETFYWLQGKITDKSGYVKGKNVSFTTNRKIKFDSKASAVTKKYGKVKKKKVASKDIFHKYMKYGTSTIDTSQWKSYLEYTYKKGKNQYKIRFYLNKKDKVVAVAYLKNLNSFYKYPDKEMKTGLTFTSPRGTRVTTKTIGGKKVYILPKGTKISFDKSKANIDGLEYYFSQYDPKGNLIADNGGLGEFYFDKDYVIDDLISNCYTWNAKKSKITNRTLNINSLGDYRYFVLYFYPNNYSHGKNLAPQIYYFRIK